MGAPAFSAETAFLRGCARTYLSEIGFSPEAEAQMTVLGLCWPAVHQALRCCRVMWSDKQEAEDTKSIVVGTDCDGERLRLTVSWSAGRYSVLVVSVERL